MAFIAWQADGGKMMGRQQPQQPQSSWGGCRKRRTHSLKNSSTILM